MSNSLTITLGIFLLAAVVIGIVGTQIAKLADQLADQTGLGEALVGVIFLGGTTSLAGLVTCLTAAAHGHAELAISNALGGIAAQTAFLAIADIAYRKANLEHAAASVANLTQGALLVTLLAIVLLAMTTPQMTLFGIHPASILLLITYIFGLRLVSEAQKKPMWGPQPTPETQVDEPQNEPLQNSELGTLWLRFGFFAIVTAVGGYVVARTGVSLSEQIGLSETLVGGLFTALSTALPELVTSVAAVQRGALTLAVGGIIGGNTFDVLFVALSDFAYQEGSIYHALTQAQSFAIALTILMTGILLLGLLRREKHGIGNIGFESFLILLLYLGGCSLLFFGMPGSQNL